MSFRTILYNNQHENHIKVFSYKIKFASTMKDRYNVTKNKHRNQYLHKSSF